MHKDIRSLSSHRIYNHFKPLYRARQKSFYSTCSVIDYMRSAVCDCMTFFGTTCHKQVQYIPRNMHTVFALLCFAVVIHWLIFPYPSGLLHWHCGNLTIAPVPAKQPWWIWINISCEFIMNDCITTTKQSTTEPCAYFLGYTVSRAATSDNSVSVVCNYFVRELDKSSFVAHGIRATLNERLCIISLAPRLFVLKFIRANSKEKNHSPFLDDNVIMSGYRHDRHNKRVERFWLIWDLNFINHCSPMISFLDNTLSDILHRVQRSVQNSGVLNEGECIHGQTISCQPLV